MTRRIRPLLIVASLAFVLSPLGWASAYGPDGSVDSPPRQATIAFTPHLTPLVMTVTLAPTVPAAFTMQASPVPMPPTPVAGTPVPVRGLSGGDQTVGYDFIEGSEPPLWRIWFEGRQLVVDPSDPSTSALLAAFLDQASLRAQAEADYESAEKAVDSGSQTAGLGFVGFVAGGVIAGISCAGVPFTFWAMGGTGWTCALGVVGAVAGGGTVLVSLGDRGQAVDDEKDAQVRLDKADTESSNLFDSLEQTSAP